MGNSLWPPPPDTEQRHRREHCKATGPHVQQWATVVPQDPLFQRWGIASTKSSWALDAAILCATTITTSTTVPNIWVQLRYLMHFIWKHLNQPSFADFYVFFLWYLYIYRITRIQTLEYLVNIVKNLPITFNAVVLNLQKIQVFLENFCNCFGWR